MDEGAGTICTCSGNECCSLCPKPMWEAMDCPDVTDDPFYEDFAPEPYDGIMWGDDD